MTHQADPHPHAGNYPLNALISHAFGNVKSPMQYTDDYRINLEMEKLKRDEHKQKSLPNLNGFIMEYSSPNDSSHNKLDYSSHKDDLSNSFHFYDNRPTTAFNFKPIARKQKNLRADDFKDCVIMADPHTSDDLEKFAKLLFDNLDKTLDSTQKHLEQRLKSQDTELENIQKQIENLAHDSGLVDLYDQSL